MELTMRAYEPRDFWRIRAFLRDTFLQNGREELNWQCYRWEYWVWHGVANLDQGPLEEKVFLWETPEGEIAAVLNSEGKGSNFLQLDPELRTEELEDEMIGVAEERLWTISSRDGRQRLGVWAHEADSLREKILERRGFRVRPEATMHDRWMQLESEIPEPVLPPGYSVRPMGDGIELLDRCYVSGLAFHPDNPAQAHENREDVTWYRNIQRAPLYRRDLDIVAIAPDASVASFATIWFDDITLTAACEPVATAPSHQKKGLAKACIHEGLRRARDMGATLGFVGSGEEPAHKCYASAGLKDYLVSQMWIKELD
jgi:GNAT superfamily N-acetyltransferase